MHCRDRDQGSYHEACQARHAGIRWPSYRCCQGVNAINIISIFVLKYLLCVRVGFVGAILLDSGLFVCWNLMALSAFFKNLILMSSSFFLEYLCIRARVHDY